MDFLLHRRCFFFSCLFLFIVLSLYSVACLVYVKISHFSARHITFSHTLCSLSWRWYWFELTERAAWIMTDKFEIKISIRNYWKMFFFSLFFDTLLINWFFMMKMCFPFFVCLFPKPSKERKYMQERKSSFSCVYRFVSRLWVYKL